jgi:hypothetical protein
MTQFRKITAYVQLDRRPGILATIIPSGFRGAYVMIEEDSTYNLGVTYATSKVHKELLKALKDEDIAPFSKSNK